MHGSEKFILAICIVLVIFLSTNLMILPVLRRKKDRSDTDSPKVIEILLRPRRSKSNEAMEELSRRVEQLKRDKPPAEEKKGP